MYHVIHSFIHSFSLTFSQSLFAHQLGSRWRLEGLFFASRLPQHHSSKLCNAHYFWLPHPCTRISSHVLLSLNKGGWIWTQISFLGRKTYKGEITVDIFFCCFFFSSTRNRIIHILVWASAKWRALHKRPARVSLKTDNWPTQAPSHPPHASQSALAPCPWVLLMWRERQAPVPPWMTRAHLPVPLPWRQSLFLEACVRPADLHHGTQTKLKSGVWTSSGPTWLFFFFF